MPSGWCRLVPFATRQDYYGHPVSSATVRYRWVECGANGVLGDPAGASAAEGERLLAQLTQGLNDAMDRLLEQLG